MLSEKRNSPQIRASFVGRACYRVLSHSASRIALLAILAVLSPTSSYAVSLEDAIRQALDSNPQIGAAIANRNAIDFELDQAQGLYLPKVDFEGRTGAQNRDSPATRTAGTNNDVLFRNEVNVIVSQLLYDGGERRGELERQAARIDGAARRVFERSEFIGFNVTRQYLEIGRLIRIVAKARANLDYHNRVLSDISRGTSAGAISIADKQQASERVAAAKARIVEFTEELNSAKIRFLALVGQDIGRYRRPRSVARLLPGNLTSAIGTARANSPTVQIAKADIDATYALLKKAKSQFAPRVSLEGRARAGDDLDGIYGRETDLRAELVVRWNLYKGGIDEANTQEQLRRIDEARYTLHKAHRDVEEAVRLSWERRRQQRRRLDDLRSQLRSANSVVGSYREQFKVGGRSLLDLLDAQNTRFNTQVGVATAEAAGRLAEYRVLASIGQLLKKMGIDAPDRSDADAREEVDAPHTPEAETEKRWEPREIRHHGWEPRITRH